MTSSDQTIVFYPLDMLRSLDGQPKPHRPWKHLEQRPMPELTPGQEDAWRELRVMFNARFYRPHAAGVHPHCHALVIGSSGSGKSFLARELARLHDLPLLEVTTGSWILQGARSDHPTLDIISAWIHEAVSAAGRGVLLIDDLG